jgi:hypothetical protein
MMPFEKTHNKISTALKRSLARLYAALKNPTKIEKQTTITYF